jgi:hypothetical protein
LIVKLHWHRNHAPEGNARPVWYSGGLDDGSMVHVCAWADAAIDATAEPAREYVSPVTPAMLKRIDDAAAADTGRQRGPGAGL